MASTGQVAGASMLLGVIGTTSYYFLAGGENINLEPFALSSQDVLFETSNCASRMFGSDLEIDKPITDASSPGDYTIAAASQLDPEEGCIVIDSVYGDGDTSNINPKNSFSLKFEFASQNNDRTSGVIIWAALSNMSSGFKEKKVVYRAMLLKRKTISDMWNAFDGFELHNKKEFDYFDQGLKIEKIFGKDVVVGPLCKGPEDANKCTPLVLSELKREASLWIWKKEDQGKGDLTGWFRIRKKDGAQESSPPLFGLDIPKDDVLKKMEIKKIYKEGWQSGTFTWNSNSVSSLFKSTSLNGTWINVMPGLKTQSQSIS